MGKLRSRLKLACCRDDYLSFSSLLAIGYDLFSILNISFMLGHLISEINSCAFLRFSRERAFLCIGLPYTSAPPNIPRRCTLFSRHSSSSKRWRNRQNNDKFALKAKVQSLKSRAAFKLLEVGGT